MCLIGTLEDILVAFPLGDRVAHFTVSGKAPLRTSCPSTPPRSIGSSTEGGSTAVWLSSPTLRILSYPRPIIRPPGSPIRSTTTSIQRTVSPVYMIYTIPYSRWDRRYRLPYIGSSYYRRIRRRRSHRYGQPVRHLHRHSKGCPKSYLPSPPPSLSYTQQPSRK
jgi:hypothetical protein